MGSEIEVYIGQA